MMDEAVAIDPRRGEKALPEAARDFSLPPALFVGLGAILVLIVLIVLGRLGLIEGAFAIAGVAAFSLWGLRREAVREERREEEAGAPALDLGVAQFAAILTEPCFIVNARAVLVYCNPAAQNQFPRARTGDPLAFTLRDPDLVEAMEKALATGTPQTSELQIAAPNDTWFRASVVPYTPEAGGPSFIVLTLYDFTEQKRADRMRADFIANASHQLRTPLTSLMGFIDTLQGPAAKDEAARARFLGIMRGQAERMASLIEDLLSLTRIELRQHVRPTTPVTLNILLREVADSLETRASEAGLKLDIVLPQEDVTVIGDRRELFEVVENLAENAIKYGGEGKRVEIALVAQANRLGDHHAITVTDFGSGIAEEHVPRLTERFYRVEDDANRRKKGTGLGLAIVKHIVARHHGQMAIRSTPGEGTRVEVLLPAA